MVVLVPKPRMLKGWPVGWSWPAGTVKLQTPGILLTIWSTLVSGIAWICSRVSTVVLTSRRSMSLPRPAVTVMGGSVAAGDASGAVAAGGAPEDAGDGWVWARAKAGVSASTTTAARVAARIDNIEFF